MARFIDFRPDHSVPGRRETGEEFINAKYNAKYIKKVYLALPLRNEIRIDTVDKNGNTRSFTERYKNAKDCRARMNELKRKLNIF